MPPGAVAPPSCQTQAAPTPVSWQADGTPRSTLFDDVYRSQAKGTDLGLTQAQQVFLQGCGLWAPEGQHLAWSGHAHWHVLETGFGLGLNFLATWHAWRSDPHRPKSLFFTSIEAWPVSVDDLLKSAAAWPVLGDLVQELALQWRGLVPGMHRIELAQGQVHLGLCIGPITDALKALDVPAQSIFLDGFSPDVNPEMWSLPTLKAVTRLAESGTRLSTWCVRKRLRDDLAQCGFNVQRLPGLPPKVHRLQALYQPAWNPKSNLSKPRPTAAPTDVLILGAGLAGSACAHSLACRGIAVTVLDAGAELGAGASGLPVGLTAAHVSPDDNVLSRITRAGVRATLQRCEWLLQRNTDWAPSGVLEHRVEGKRALPGDADWPAAGHEWNTPASGAHKAQAGLADGQAALWHPMAAWLRPRQLVAAQLQHKNIRVRWGCESTQVRRQDGQWQVLNAQGQVIAQAAHIVVATAYASKSLLAGIGPGAARIPFNPLRGQVSMGKLSDLPASSRATLPTVPVNGHGSFISGVQLPTAFGGEAAWYLGSTFEREAEHAQIRPEDHLSNRARLSRLLPHLAPSLHTAFEAPQVMAWAGLRCTLPDRLPAVGAVDEARWPGLSVCAGFGARGLSLSVLAGEWIAAQLCGEPSPLLPGLSKHWSAQRFFKDKS